MHARPSHIAYSISLASVLLAASAMATPTLRNPIGDAVVETGAYRATFLRDTLDMTLELKRADGSWMPVTKNAAGLTFAVMRGPSLLQSNGLRATRSIVTQGDAVVVARQGSVNPAEGSVIDLTAICTDDGILMGARIVGAKTDGVVWAPPRLTLSANDWDGYAYYNVEGQRKSGLISSLTPTPAYAGVSAWEQQGDISRSLAHSCPALIVYSSGAGVGLGVVFQDYADAWRGSSSFLQRCSADLLYLYGGYSGVTSSQTRWAWLAPFGAQAPDVERSRVQKLVEVGATLSAIKVSVPPIPEGWTKPLADYPQSLRRPTVVNRIEDAAVYTINEGIAGSDYGLQMARKVGSDMLIRAWFKWGNAPEVSRWTDQPTEAHKMGSLFGGGITCSALYDGENGLTTEQVRDMATRGPDGSMVDAWGVAGIRHGSLSSPAYLDYLFRWCREQIDAGADYLFMDETNAALGENEGYDDRSLLDLREFLLTRCPQTHGWSLDDKRWRDKYAIDLNDPDICPNGRMDTFSYRAYLRKNGHLLHPTEASNRLAPLWFEARRQRDDRSWKALTQRIRDYGKSKGRTIFISGNGLVPYVDLQVLGIWDRWTTDNGHVDLRTNQLPAWRAQVVKGQAVAARKVPVVLFHDWGIGDIPFPWMAVIPTEREVWMRTRGAEIYAAGGYFAFPVQGPFGCDAGRDGTLTTIANLTRYYQTHSDMYKRSRWLGFESVSADAQRLSTALGWRDDTKSLLVHVINRDIKEGVLQARGPITVTIPVAGKPSSVKLISPDFEGERALTACRTAHGVQLTFPSLDAYTLAIVRFSKQPDLSPLIDKVKIRPEGRWARPERSEFTVLPDGSVKEAEYMHAYIQGMLHTEMRNPPTFTMNAGRAASVRVHVRSVATAGARLQFRIDGKLAKTVDIPDKDGKNDGSLDEYDMVIQCPVAPGSHRVTIDNVGGDWVVLDWFCFDLGIRGAANPGRQLKK